MRKNKSAKMKKKLPISVAMVVCNEEDLIRRALESCADLVDEIVIIHDGPCNDKTLKIAKEFHCRIFVQKHIGAPEPHRPFSFEKTRNEWVLQLDADEYLNIDFREQLSTLIKQNVPGYTVNWIEKIGNKQFINMPKEVLFQKNQIYYIGAPCEYVKPSNHKEKLVHAEVGLINAPKKSNYDNWNHYTEKYGRIREIQASKYVLPFAELATWNYQGKNWDWKTKIKINHPFLLGIVGMNVKFLIELSKKFTGQQTALSVRAILHQMWYNTTLYWRVFQKKSNKVTI